MKIVSEWHDSQKKPNSNFLKLLQERIEKSNPRRKEFGFTAGMLKGSFANGREKQ